MLSEPVPGNAEDTCYRRGIVSAVTEEGVWIFWDDMGDKGMYDWDRVSLDMVEVATWRRWVVEVY